jgi:hypothetical protein
MRIIIPVCYGIVLILTGLKEVSKVFGTCFDFWTVLLDVPGSLKANDTGNFGFP